MNALATAAGLVMAATGIVHSLLGERRLIGPLLASGAFAGVRKAGPAMRFTWHLAGLLMMLSGLTVAWPGTPAGLVRMIGAFYLLLGLLALVLTRGRHVSGPMFTAGGVLALLA